MRGAYKLEVTELEVTTLAFAVLTGVIYYLWWNKPLDVRCSIPIYLLVDDEKEKVEFQHTSSVSPVAHPADIPTTISRNLNLANRDSQLLAITQETVTSDPEPNSQKPSESPSNDFTTPPELQYTRMQRFSSFIQRQRQTHGTVLGLAYAFFLYPVLSFFRAFNAMLISVSLDDSMPLRVPTFYAPTFTDYDPFDTSELITLGMCVAIVFGGIHCVAWSFHFPTLQEKLAWRISASSIAGLPIFTLAFIILGAFIDIRSEIWKNIVDIVFTLMAIASFALYVIARMVLLVLPCIALRAPNPVALVEMQWAAFFPHIG